MGDDQTDTSIDLEVRMSPNPTSGSTTIQWNLSQGMHITVIDINGTIVHQEQVTSGMRELTLNLEHAGIYIVEFELEGRRKRVGKIVKL